MQLRVTKLLGNKVEMARTYTLKKRAESQAATRRRIAEAAIELHSTVGPSQTTFSMVAERAGVQRHTLYAHFPDEWSLLLECSGLYSEREPLPDPAAWRDSEHWRERLRTGLLALYGWYERNAQLAANVLRDAERDPQVRELVTLRWGPTMAAYREVLGAGLSPAQRAMLHLALSFFTWRSLVRESGLNPEGAVEAMVQAVDCAMKS
jgi:AcrR family transcriptional regulator